MEAPRMGKPRARHRSRLPIASEDLNLDSDFSRLERKAVPKQLGLQGRGGPAVCPGAEGHHPTPPVLLGWIPFGREGASASCKTFSRTEFYAHPEGGRKKGPTSRTFSCSQRRHLHFRGLQPRWNRSPPSCNSTRAHAACTHRSRDPASFPASACLGPSQWWEIN